jgi:hypothetical protein
VSFTQRGATAFRTRSGLAFMAVTLTHPAASRNTRKSGISIQYQW